MKNQNIISQIEKLEYIYLKNTDKINNLRIEINNLQKLKTIYWELKLLNGFIENDIKRLNNLKSELTHVQSAGWFNSTMHWEIESERLLSCLT